MVEAVQDRQQFIATAHEYLFPQVTQGLVLRPPLSTALLLQWKLTLPPLLLLCEQKNIPLPVFAGTLSVILSRALSEASGDLPYTLVPALDLANHSLNPGCSCVAPHSPAARSLI